MKKRTINVEDMWGVKGEAPSSGKSTLIFNSEKYKIKIHFGDYLIDYIAEELWEIIKERQTRLNSNKKAMKGDE